LRLTCFRVLVELFCDWANGNTLMDSDAGIIGASVQAALVRDLDYIDGANGDVLLIGNDYPAGYRVPRHVHRRTQLLCAFAGVALVETERGRFMIPPGHALLIPPGLSHAVEMLSEVAMKSVYITAERTELIADRPLVFEASDLARSLLLEALRQQELMIESRKADLVKTLLVEEILALEERPLGLPFPSDRRLSALCRKFMADPSPNARLDIWAEKLAMSRRTFTRFFRQQTRVSFVTWRQQASVFACLPRLAEGHAVTEIALEAGYESAAAFTTMFRRVLGTTPRAYAANGRSFAGAGNVSQKSHRERITEVL
jgi:AraC-like DNA-binding protein/mannose-6-phosphate isomerase-like protein (cupin superfamily)